MGEAPTSPNKARPGKPIPAMLLPDPLTFRCQGKNYLAAQQWLVPFRRIGGQPNPVDGGLFSDLPASEDILDHCCYAWNQFIDQSWETMSIGTRDWPHQW
jgi:hypothetical protein